jgi:hypothetical protein
METKCVGERKKQTKRYYKYSEKGDIQREKRERDTYTYI